MLNNFIGGGQLSGDGEKRNWLNIMSWLLRVVCGKVQGTTLKLNIKIIRFSN
jgi:hypothetical protein